VAIGNEVFDEGEFESKCSEWETWLDECFINEYID
jgi:hypothetical protein